MTASAIEALQAYFAIIVLIITTPLLVMMLVAILSGR